MIAWLQSIPLDKLEETYQSLKDELTGYYKEELRLLTEHRVMPRGKRDEFYEAEKEIVMKLILLAGGYEVTKIMSECWSLARKAYPAPRPLGPSYLLDCQEGWGLR